MTRDGGYLRGAVSAEGAPSREVPGVDLALPASVASGGQPRPLLPGLERVEVLHVLFEEHERALPLVWRAVTWHHHVGHLHERGEPSEGGAVGLQRPSR